jgi:alpha-mannosidase
LHSGKLKIRFSHSLGRNVYSGKLQAVQVDAHAGTLPLRHSFVAAEAQNLVLTGVKRAEDSNALIVRFYEWAGKDGDVRLHIPKGATAAGLTNLLTITLWERPARHNVMQLANVPASIRK